MLVFALAMGYIRGYLYTCIQTSSFYLYFRTDLELRDKRQKVSKHDYTFHSQSTPSGLFWRVVSVSEDTRFYFITSESGCGVFVKTLQYTLLNVLI
jgi:hypothetical protein